MNKVTCQICGSKNRNIARILGICLKCIREYPEKATQQIIKAHTQVRLKHGLPSTPPSNPYGIECGICSNHCIIGKGELGYCGLRWNDGSLSSHVSAEKGLLHSYLDPHPTNCCSAWFCPGGTGRGYPHHAYQTGPEHGYLNLAVFLYGCNFNCLYCQNASHKDLQFRKTTDVETFTEIITTNPRISCICFFGGSPEPQLPFTIKASENILERVEDRLIRVCYEWNGCGQTSMVGKASEIVLKSGGNIKFDLKAHNPILSKALSGVDNGIAYKNFANIAKKLYNKRPEIPVLTATTLLVPGYVDSEEIERIASFISNLNSSIPYSLLIFHPDYWMRDLPATSINQVIECYGAAVKHLENVHVGNLHLIGLRSMGEFMRVLEKNHKN